jgi:hypothetical protein
MTVMPGTQKVTFNGRDTDYESKKRAAIAQSGPNSYVQGVQNVMDDGAGVAIQNSRTKYGNVNVMPQQILEGATSNFQQRDSPANAPLDDLPNQTGSIQTEASSTNVPQKDPETMETDALEQRLAKMARGGQGFPGLNNRNREV